MSNPKPKPRAKRWHVALFIPLVPLLLATVMVWLLFFLVSTVCLHIAIWSWWCIRGRDILFLYSDSPVWYDYIQQRLLPDLGERAVVLNWSQRKSWRLSLARMAVRHFGGSREYNPLAVVFRPFRRTRTFRFWQPFRDFKHGNLDALHRMESEFFGLIGVQRHDPSAQCASPNGGPVMSLGNSRAPEGPPSVS